ncbi:MAG: hypothetical protein R3C61_15615 [Bacteroidia bacterium]
MGLIICDRHGDQVIVLLSNLLFQAIEENTAVDVLELVFEIEGMEDEPISYFQMGGESISWLANEMEFFYFEEKLMQMPGSAAICSICFSEYLNKRAKSLEEKKFLIKDG